MCAPRRAPRAEGVKDTTIRQKVSVQKNIQKTQHAIMSAATLTTGVKTRQVKTPRIRY